MKLVAITAVLFLTVTLVLIRLRKFVFSKWGGILTLRVLVHIVLLLLIAVGVYYSFELNEDTVPQKFILSASFGAFLFWISPFCLKAFKSTLGVALFIALSLLTGAFALYIEFNSVLKEYFIEFSIGIILLLLLESVFKAQNKVMKEQMIQEYDALLASIEKENSAKVAQDAERERVQQALLQKYNEDDYKYAMHDYFGIPRPIFPELEEDEGEGIDK